MSLVLIIGVLAVIVVLVGAYVVSQGGGDAADDGPEVPYIPIDGTTDVEAPPVAEAVSEAATEVTEAMDDALEAAEPLLPATEEEKKKKSGGIMGSVKRSRSVKSIGKAVSGMLK